MFRRMFVISLVVGLIGLAHVGTTSAGQQTLIGVVRAALPQSREAASVKVGGVVYKITKDVKGRKVATEAKNQKVEILGTVEGKNGSKWITVISCKIVE